MIVLKRQVAPAWFELHEVYPEVFFGEDSPGLLGSGTGTTARVRTGRWVYIDINTPSRSSRGRDPYIGSIPKDQLDFDHPISAEQFQMLWNLLPRASWDV